MNNSTHHKLFAPVAMALFCALSTFAWAADPPSLFTNTGSIANTRHNLGQSTLPNFPRNIMNSFRNSYKEVCVYCHTPHGSHTLQNMPLWNRTIKSTSYTTYNSFTLTQGTAPQPGNNSLTCLTCHDGQTAIDSIVNMPGSDHVAPANQGTVQNNAFLSTWINPAAPAEGSSSGNNHLGMASQIGFGGFPQGCMTCHNGTAGIGDFAMFYIGTDLRNDHPVGIDFPAASGVGYFNQPGGTKGTAKFFDVNSNGLMEKDEVRLYNTGGTVRVECASCHDPHGVPDPENSPKFKPTFLRVKNGGATGSALCLTCHNK